MDQLLVLVLYVLTFGIVDPELLQCIRVTPVSVFDQMSFQDPSTPIMESITDLHTFIMFYVAGIVVFVFGAISHALYQFWWSVRTHDDDDRLDNLDASKVVHSTWLELVWTLIPVAVLLVIAVPSFALLYSMEEKFDVPLTVKAVGHQWYWEYQYAALLNRTSQLFSFDSYMLADSDLTKPDYRLLSADSTMLLPVWSHLRVLTTSADVIHSWAVPSAGVKMDAIPGRLNQVNLYFNRSGHFYGQCSELCGVGHGFMPVAVKALSLNGFLAWKDRFHA